MYNENFARELETILMEKVQKLSVELKGAIQLTFNKQEVEDAIVRYEELVPEFKGISYPFNEETWEWMARLVSKIFDEIDYSLVAHTSIAKYYVNKKKVREAKDVAMEVFKNAFSAMSGEFAEGNDPYGVNSFKTNKNFQKKLEESKQDMNKSYQRMLIEKAFENAMKQGNTTVAEELKKLLKEIDNSGFKVVYTDELFNKAVNVISGLLNSLLKYVCKHEEDILMEYVYYKDVFEEYEVLKNAFCESGESYEKHIKQRLIAFKLAKAFEHALGQI